jgi:PAS domain S-box-containing protein
VEQYVLEALRNDEEFGLYRDEHSNQPGSRSVLLRVPASAHPGLETLRKIEHEFSLRDELDPAWAVRSLAVCEHRGRTTLMLEDPGGETLDQFLSRPMQMTRFLGLAVGLATALSGLHRKELIHKDVKPANILVDSGGHVRLMGFGIASRLPRERQAPEPPEYIAGTLPYMAPEQTGRMNRSIDSRSDLYALGVTLYEMLTGSLPFAASDPMEWVHCHIARQPVPPGERLNGIPDPVSAIIMKLLAKTPEERYQTAAGVESDLRRCLAEWERQHRIDEFPLGQQDTPDRLLIPEKLYGRESEIAALLAAFDRVVTSSRPELVLVSGYSGIGKSSIVNELHKPLVPPRGLFASGKFDQYRRDIPYATLAQAFQSLLLPLLSKNEAELSKWREALRQALDPNGQLIVDLVPELKLIIGEQPPVPELPPQDAQGRFQLVFRRFINVFAQPEHPLALFLDDLQWLDAATLDLLEDLLTQPDVRHFMLIGAYRDNEVNSSHPLIRKLEAIRHAGARVQEIALAPLAVEDLEPLLGDSVHCEPECATPLAQLIHEKTAGNPFFAIQFISALTEEGLLTFDHSKGRWSWDLNRIRAKGYTDNVVDLLIGKLNRLPVETQKALQLLSCMGNSAEFDLLEMASQHSNEEMHGRLWEAVRAGLIFRMEDSYRFLHDRVQEAAYSLIPEESRAEAHLRIGRLLVAHIPPESREGRIFDIVNQLNRGEALITARDKREQLAELNLMAGKRAKASAAYTSALMYFTAGTSLLVDDSWEQLHERMFSLELNRAECEFLTGQLAAAEARLIRLSSRAANAVELAAVTSVRVDLYTTLDQSDRAVAVCLEYLKHIGIEWSPHPTREEGRREYDRIRSQLGSRSIEELIELPLMSDPASLATLDVLTKVLHPALFTDVNLLSLAICRAVNLTLERGNSDASCLAYAWLGQVAGPHFCDYKAAFQFGRLGYELVDKRGLRRFQARTYMIFGHHVMPWAKHVLAGRGLLQRTFEAANTVGDLCCAAYSCANLNSNLLATGDPLPDVQLEAENGLTFARNARFGLVVDLITTQLRFIRTLRGLTSKFGSFDYEEFDQLQFERHLEGNALLAITEFWYWVRKLQACFLAGDYASAVDASLRAQRLLWSVPSNFETVDYHYYAALSLASSWDSASSTEKQQAFDAQAAHQRQLEVWAENCPENFENRAALVSAEIARIEDRVLDAEQLYEKAIRSAHLNGFIHNEALANELAARFYAARGFDKIADAYLRDARYCYLRWGADGKVKQLDRLYPHVKKKEPVPGGARTIVTPIEVLDLATVINVSQAVSGEIVLEKLIDRIMRVAIEHAGAERGLLIFPRGHELQIEAEATTTRGDVTVHMRDDSAAGVGLPESLIRYVTRTHESVILDDASSQNGFSTDPYILQHQTRSILCLPLINQAKLTGVLYLENNLASHVFTPERITVLKVLASQAAISLENTRLYRDLEDREAKIRRLVDANVLGIFFWNLEGAIVGANEAFLRMVEYSREDLVSGRVRWTDLTPDEWRERDEQAIADVIRTGTVQPFEKEYFRKDGTRVPVLLGSAMFEGSRDGGVAFVLDLSEQKRAEGEIGALKDQLYRENLALRDAYREISELKEKLVQEKLYLEQEIRSDMDFEQIVGNSPALKRVLQLVETVGPSDSTVLLLGETGTGKELVARAIHDRSGRKDRTFVKVNCAAIPTGLLESELFGHEKGAFTGAIAQRIGRLDLADQGTLFLDEVGDIPIEIQPKLLRALQEREFERLGSTHTRKVNVRLIAATNRDLEKMIAAREFRSDLYYRLNVFPIRIPPLRERKGDIPLLVSYFVQKFAKQMQKKIDTIPAAVMKALTAWEWLGNVRELENFIERAVILTRGSSLEAPLAELRKVRIEEPKDTASNHEDVARIVRETINALHGKNRVVDERANKQRDAIVRALTETNGRVGGADGAAARMGINRTTLLARMKKYGIDPKQYA